MQAGEEVDIGLATFMGDVTRTHVWSGTPSVNEAVTKINYATERLEQYIAEGGYHLDADKTHHLVGLR
eukprot:2844602-Pyramimonas_sp.AAC.1